MRCAPGVVFTDFYSAHHGRVLTYARRRTDDEEAARDITAETFTIARRRLDLALERGLPWLCSTAARVVGCSAATAHVRLHRARRRLRDLLDQPAPDSSTPSRKDT